MKNAIIAALAAYIFYGFCVVRNIAIPFIVFALFWVMIEEIDEDIADFKKYLKRKEIQRGRKGRGYE